jgi:hypothetical protein
MTSDIETWRATLAALDAAARDEWHTGERRLAVLQEYSAAEQELRCKIVAAGECCGQARAGNDADYCRCSAVRQMVAEQVQERTGMSWAHAHAWAQYCSATPAFKLALAMRMSGMCDGVATQTLMRMAHEQVNRSADGTGQAAGGDSSADRGGG